MIHASAKSIVLLLLCKASLVSAIVDPEPNRIGMYFDLGADIMCTAMPSPFPSTNVYIILTNPTYTTVHGWEASIHSTGDSIAIEGTCFAPGSVNTGDGSEFIVTFDIPMVTTTTTILAIVTLVPNATEECLFLTGVEHPSFPSTKPLVWFNDEPGLEIQPSHALPNGVGAIIGTCNSLIGLPIPCEEVVRASQVQWGVLKSLYR